jgi:gamma-glutamyltranspeptidase/glutathione hydrolase
VYELPPPTQGLAAAAILVRLQAGIPFQEARNQSYALRDRYITDPDFSATPVEPFLDPAYTTSDRASAREGGDTVYLCAADEHGNLVSLIQSVAYDFGSGVVAEGTGRLEPKKRTMHTLIPAMAARDGGPWAAFGTMGGERQPQLQAQVFVNLVDHGLDPQEAVASPRIAVQADGVSLAVEADHPDAAELARSDSNVLLMPPKHHTFGHAAAIVVDGPNAWRAGADPRSDGSVEYVRS